MAFCGPILAGIHRSVEKVATMQKSIYSSPQAELVPVVVERGFAASEVDTVTGANTVDGIDLVDKTDETGWWE